MVRHIKAWVYLMDVTKNSSYEWQSLPRIEYDIDCETLQLDCLALAGDIKEQVEIYCQETPEM